MDNLEENCKSTKNLDCILIKFGVNRVDLLRKVVAVYEFSTDNNGNNETKTYRLEISRNIEGECPYEAKVYIHRDEQGAWEDIGMGYVVQKSAEMALRQALSFLQDKKILPRTRE